MIDLGTPDERAAHQSHTRQLPPPSRKRRRLSWHLPPEVLDSTVQMVIAAFGQTYSRINKVMGWGKLEHDLWEIELRKIYNR